MIDVNESTRLAVQLKNEQDEKRCILLNYEDALRKLRTENAALHNVIENAKTVAFDLITR